MPAKSLFSTSYDCSSEASSSWGNCSSEASSSWGSVRGSCCTSSCWLTVRIPSRMSRITSVSVLAIVPGRRKWNRTRMRPCSHTSVRRIADGSSIDSPISDLSSFSYSCRGSPRKTTPILSRGLCGVNYRCRLAPGAYLPCLLYLGWLRLMTFASLLRASLVLENCSILTLAPGISPRCSPIRS